MELNTEPAAFQISGEVNEGFSIHIYIKSPKKMDLELLFLAVCSMASNECSILANSVEGGLYPVYIAIPLKTNVAKQQLFPIISLV